MMVFVEDGCGVPVFVGRGVIDEVGEDVPVSVGMEVGVLSFCSMGAARRGLGLPNVIRQTIEQAPAMNRIPTGSFGW